MADESTGTPRMWCPFCLTTVDDLERCPTCGLLQTGLMPARLRDIVVRLHEISDEQTALGVEQSTLADERVRLLAEVRGEPAPGSPPVAVRSRAEPPVAGTGDWRPERVRDALLWLGAVLLALSAITFAIVAWARLDPAGRAALLLGATAVAGGSAFGLRHRLRATAEALTGLTLAFALVDWYVLRRAGVGEGLDVATWWAIGTALIAALSFGTAVQLGLRSARLGAPLLGLTSAAFVVGATTSELWVTAAVCALVAGVAVVVAIVADRADWRDVGAVLAGGCVGFELVALGFAGAAVTDIEATADALGPAISILALGLAPAFAAAFADERRHSGTTFDLLVGLAVAAVIGAPVAFLSAELGPTGLAALAAGIGVVAVGSGRLAPSRLRLGPAGAGATAIGIALAVVASRVVLAVIGPLDWFSDAWSGSLQLPAAEHLSPNDPTILTQGWAAVAVLLAVAIAVVAACARPSWRAPLTPSVPGAPVIIGALVGALAVALPAAGASIRTALAVELAVAVALVAVAVVLDVRRPALSRWLLGGAALVMVTAAGWGVVAPSATIAVLAVVTIAAGLAGERMQTVPSRIALIMVAAAAGVAEAGVVTGTITDTLGQAGFAVAGAAGAVLVLGALGRKDAVEGPELEAVGLVGLVVGLGLCSESVVWVAGTLTVAAVALGAATLRRDRGAYAWLTAAAAVGSLWAWLAAAEVSVLEAYTVPAALVLLGAGLIRRPAGPRRRFVGGVRPGTRARTRAEPARGARPGRLGPTHRRDRRRRRLRARRQPAGGSGRR